MKKNWEDDYNSLDSIESFAYDDLQQKLYNYSKTVEKNDEEISQEKREQQKKRNRIFGILEIIVFVIICPFMLYIDINFESLLIPALPYIVLFVVFIIIAGIFCYYAVKAKKNPTSIDDYLKINDIEDESFIRDGFTPQNFHPESFADPDQKPSPYISPNNYTNEIMVFLQNTDPTFNSMEFIEWCKKSFRIFWDAWTVGNIEAARIFLNDDLYDKMRSLLQDNLDRNRRDIYRILLLSGCFINKYERESGFEYITIYLTSIHRHYVLDSSKNSHIPIEGSDSEDIKTIYQLKFTRRFTLDQKTNIKNGIQTVICPNCGAEVTALNAGRCEFCNSIIKVSEFSWVLSDIDEYLRNTTPVDNRGVIIHSAKF